MASPLAGEASSPALTDYEKQRLENVKRNHAMIDALGLKHVKTEMELDASNIKRRLRSSGVSLAIEDAHKIESARLPKPDKRILTLRDSKKRMPRMPVPLASVCIQGSSTDSLIRCLQDTSYFQSIEPSAFSLKQGDVARVMPERIMSVAFLPVSHKLLVVAGDKCGHLGFWDVECGDSGDGGVYVYRPHTAPLSGISVACSNTTKVFTCSYDGTVKRLDAETAMFDLKYCVEDGLLSAICSVPGSPHCVYIGEVSGTVTLLDTREKVPTSCYQLHRKTINTIDLNTQSPWLMVTSSTDKNVCVWDVRKLRSEHDKVGQVQHQQGVTSAQFSPSGGSIVTCSYDNTVAILRLFSRTQPTFIPHPNRIVRGISTFRALWGWDDEYVYVGNMKSTIDIISTTCKDECHWLSSPLMTSVPCRLAVHPLMRGILAGCSADGQIFVWRQ